jgi:TfoX/Sxy family transcriptional regulator of competence genes
VTFAPTTPEARYAKVVAALLGEPGVTPPADGAGPQRGFGSAGLKIHGRIFAMLVRGRLVVKLPRSRVDALVAASCGERFDPRRDGRVMKEWLDVDPLADEDWLSLAREAMLFVGAKR